MLRTATARQTSPGLLCFRLFDQQMACHPRNRTTNATTSGLISVLGRANIEGFDVRTYLTGTVDSGGMVTRMGIAVFRWRTRALMNGAGALAAFDNRTTGTVGRGQLGGISRQVPTSAGSLEGAGW